MSCREGIPLQVQLPVPLMSLWALPAALLPCLLRLPCANQTRQLNLPYPLLHCRVQAVQLLKVVNLLVQ